MLAEVVREEVEENLSLQAESLPNLDADELVGHYQRLIKLRNPETLAYPDVALVRADRSLIRHGDEVAVLLSAMASKPDWLLTHDKKHFTQVAARRTGLRLAAPTESFRRLSSLLR